MGDQDQQDLEDEWQSRSSAAIEQVGLALKELHDSNPWPHVPLLPHAMSYLMTELWDQGFSQTEIREAFQQAVEDMPRYAAGEEVRS